jgi:uncharacterized protein YbjT (DUF2867 family)
VTAEGGGTATVLVTGATGNVGRHVVDQLLAAGQRVRALTRDPATAHLPAGVEVVSGDLTRPETLAAALDGVEAMHTLTVHDCEGQEAAPAVAELARKAGVRRATVMSGGYDHAMVEAVDAAGIPLTHLDPGEFMLNTLDWAGTIRAEGVVRAPYAGWTSAMIHEADIATVAVTALLNDGHAGQTYVVTGAQAHTRVELVGMISAAIGRRLEFLELTPEQARAYWRAKEMYPDDVIDWFLAMGPDALNNGISPESLIVEELTGRPARTFAQWAREHAQDFLQ